MVPFGTSSIDEVGWVRPGHMTLAPELMRLLTIYDELQGSFVAPEDRVHARILMDQSE